MVERPECAALRPYTAFTATSRAPFENITAAFYSAKVRATVSHKLRLCTSLKQNQARIHPLMEGIGKEKNILRLKANQSI